MNNKVQSIYLIQPSQYSIGGFINGLAAGKGLGSLGSGAAGGVLGAAGSLVGGIAGNALSGGMTSGAGNIIGGLSKVASAIPGPWGAVASAGLGVIGGLANRAFGSKLNQENINAVNANIDRMGNFQSNASSFDDLSSLMSTTADATNFSNRYIGKDGWFSKRAKRRANELREAQKNAQIWQDNSIRNNLTNLLDDQVTNLEENYAALGGYLPMIHAFGGSMSNGADWSDGLTLVDNGGTHEENPLEGVPLGVDNQGNPNLVEQGEAIWNNYVFSNRLPLPNVLTNKFKIQGKDMTFADAARKIQNSSKERPNDPITKRGLTASLKRLQNAQEEVRKSMSLIQEGNNINTNNTNNTNKFDKGGNINPYAYSRDWTGFPYRDENGYTPGYLNFVKGINQDWVNRIMAGTYGSMDRFRATNKDFMPTVEQVQRLAHDDKYSDMHKALVAAYKEYIRGINPKTGKVDTRNIQPLVGGNLIPQNIPDMSIVKANKDALKLKVPEQEVGTKPYYDPTAMLRYAPVIGAGINVFSDLMGWTNKPDYSNANAVLEASKGIRDVKYEPIGDYMKYNPFDRLFYINQLNGNAGATRRNIMNTSGGNRGQAMAGLLAADYNAQNQLGQLTRQAEEYNLNQRKMVSDFNRGTNMFNSEQDLRAQIANNQNSQVRLNAAFQAARLRDIIDARTGAAKSANLSNFFQGLGDIGWEAQNRNMVNNNKALYYTMNGKGISNYKGSSTTTKAQGGYLTIKNKRRK